MDHSWVIGKLCTVQTNRLRWGHFEENGGVVECDGHYSENVMVTIRRVTGMTVKIMFIVKIFRCLNKYDVDSTCHPYTV